LLPFCQCCRESFVDASKPAIGQDQNIIARVRFRANLLNYTFHRFEIPGDPPEAPQVIDDAAYVEPFRLRDFLGAVESWDGDAIRDRQRFGDLSLEDVPPARGGSWLINGP
jgi:hypothetical protein